MPWASRKARRASASYASGGIWEKSGGKSGMTPS
jgi:hypothetical protein